MYILLILESFFNYRCHLKFETNLFYFDKQVTVVNINETFVNSFDAHRCSLER